ncbi:MAG: hypothetical protein EXR68_01120 [Dehalococcoidia bacterium]|nr:hypothetical protein [Dehalococcoidia bacterium]
MPHAFLAAIGAAIILVSGAWTLAFPSAEACCSRTPSTKVGGYTRSNGTYVQPYYRTPSNYTQRDNYSSRGNTGPFTGSAGTKRATR